MDARQELHDSGGSPAAARSRLISVCWYEPITTEAGARRGAPAGVQPLLGHHQEHLRGLLPSSVLHPHHRHRAQREDERLVDLEPVERRIRTQLAVATQEGAAGGFRGDRLLPALWRGGYDVRAELRQVVARLRHGEVIEVDQRIAPVLV